MTQQNYDAPNISNIPGSSPQEMEEFLSGRRGHGMNLGRGWGHYYQLTADSIMLDYRPDYAKRFYDGLRSFPNRLEKTGTESNNAVQLVITSLQHLPMYILAGWETGIYNEMRHFQTRGFSKAQIMELVMWANLNSGIRGLQIVYNAIGKFLPDFSDGDGNIAWPKGWAADPAAFKAGLDLTVRELTPGDRQSITNWWERNIGYTPNSVLFAMKYHPEFYKWHRARWEIIFQKLPKQSMPFIMLRQHMLTGFRDALKEAALLGKAWGISKEWMVHGLTASAYYTGFEGLYAAHDAMDTLLKDPSWS